MQYVRPHLEKELAYALHKPVRRRLPTLKVQVWRIDHQWVADLVEVQRLAKHNRGTRYLLTVLDVFSKYAWVEPLKDKTGRSLVQAWERVLKRAHPRRPRQLQTDQDKEFYNCPFQQVLKRHHIHHFSTYGDTEPSVIERLNRTLKERLYRYLTAANTLKFVDVLPQVVQGYNASWHCCIQRAPQAVTPHNELQVWNQLYPERPNQPPKLKAGDRVRLDKQARPFQKGYLSGWTEEVFVVRRVLPGSVPTYKVEECDGTLVEGTFYEPELQRVTVDVNTLWRIEKVLKRRNDQWYVLWKGWPGKYDSWIRRQNLAWWPRRPRMTFTWPYSVMPAPAGGRMESGFEQSVLAGYLGQSLSVGSQTAVPVFHQMACETQWEEDIATRLRPDGRYWSFGLAGRWRTFHAGNHQLFGNWSGARGFVYIFTIFWNCRIVFRFWTC